MRSTTANPLEALDVAGDYSIVLWLDIDGLRAAPVQRLVVEMRRQGEHWSVKTMPYSDGDEYGPHGIGPALAEGNGVDGDPQAVLRSLLQGRVGDGFTGA